MKRPIRVLSGLVCLCVVGVMGCSAKGPGITLQDMQSFNGPRSFKSTPPPRGDRFHSSIVIQVPSEKGSKSVRVEQRRTKGWSYSDGRRRH